MSDTPTAPDSGGKLLDKKVGGIKAQYLILFGLAVALGAYYWRKYQAKKNPVVPQMVDTSGAAGGPTTSSSDGGNGGTGTPQPPVGQTNGQWGSAALNAAIGNGSVNATDGANAVSAFLNGQTLTPSQAVIIGKLITAYGQPPEGVLPVLTGPPAMITPVTTTAGSTPAPAPAPVPAAPAPAPAPTPAAPAPSGPSYPLPSGSYFGPRSGPANSVSGYYNNRAALQTWQQQMANRGYAITPDGLYGPQTAGVASAFQASSGLKVDGLIGPQTWAAAFR